MFSKRTVVTAALGVSVLVLLLLIGCAKAGEEATPKPGVATATPIPTPTPQVGLKPESGGILRLVGLDPEGWDPHATVSYRTTSCLSWVYDKLVNWGYGPEYSPLDYTPVPDLAESWEISNDGLAYTFHLYKGVKFQNKPPVNGREMVAEDVKYSFERFKNSNQGYAYWWNVVERIECPDKYTVVFKLKEVYAPFLTYFGSDSSWVLAKEVEEKYGDFKPTAAAIGTGPWMVKSYQPSVAVIYVKNPDYFIKGLPYIDEVHYIVSPDASTNLAALRAGQIDVGGVGFENYASVKASNPELTFIEYPAGYMNYIHMRCDVPPFNDVRVRQAVGMAIDWQGWIEARYWGKGHVQGPVPLFLEEFYLPPEKLGEGGKYQVYNPTEAKRLLAEAGYPNGFDTIMNFTAGYSAAWVEDCELMIDYLNKVGIRAKINLKEYAAHIATTTWGKYDGMAYCPSTGFYDVDSYLYGRFHSSLEKNISRVNDPVLDALLEKTRKAIGHKEYVQAIQDAAKYLAVQSYSYIQPAWTGIAAVQPWVHDYEPKSVSYDPGGRFMRVWLDSRSPTRK